MSRVHVKYDEVEHLIKDGYVLLFRGKSFISKCIQTLTQSEYSHVGLASWSNGNKDPILECVEYREFYGARSINLRNYVNQQPGVIDVFMPCLSFYTTSFDASTMELRRHTHHFDGRTITRDFRHYTGLGYSYTRILLMMWYHLPFLRWMTSYGYADDKMSDKLIYPVCSTAVAHFFSKHYTDLVKFKANENCEPADISRSPILNYLFTLES
jgi:hypothetical protein